MNTLKPYIFCMAFIFLWGCSMDNNSVIGTKHPSPYWDTEKVISQSDNVARTQEQLIKSIEKTSSEKIEVEPVMPSYDPLEDHMVSFSALDEDLETVLYSIAQSVGLNLIIVPGLNEEEKLVTLNFEEVSAATVMREVLLSYDLYYEIDQNIIRVKAFEERFFTLNFLDADIEMTFEVGGDVLGAGETESTSGLSGSFKLSGKGAKKGNAYDLVELMVQRVISQEGLFSMNRLSGSLYVKDTPAGIKSVSVLINHLKEMMSRQVLIEARIIEVKLSEQFTWGIDWDVLRSGISTSTLLNSASWSLGEGLILSGSHRSYNVDSAIDALQTFGDTNIISNPSIRSKHGKPAILSVGTSFTYKKSVTTYTTTSSSQTQDQTDVEVSTVFEGLILGIEPFIEQDGNVTLLINPIISAVDRDSLEPVSVVGDSSDSISLPEVSIREMSSTIGIKSGETIFLGGLIDKYQQSEDQGFPILSSIPLLGYLFKDVKEREQARELVIVLEVTVL